jgi:hypothetical protein
MLRRLGGAIRHGLERYYRFRSSNVLFLAALEPALIISGALFIYGNSPDLGRHVKSEYYSLVAQVIPVLLLAFLVDRADRAAKVEELIEEARRKAEEPDEDHEAEDEDDAEHFKVKIHELLAMERGLALSAALAGIVGEALALYAVAADETSTFLLAGTAISLGMIAWELIAKLTRRISFGE